MLSNYQSSFSFAFGEWTMKILTPFRPYQNKQTGQRKSNMKIENTKIMGFQVRVFSSGLDHEVETRLKMLSA